MCGGSIVSKNILYGHARVRWCFREAPVNELDNGWRFLSELDDDQYVNDPANLTVCSWSTIVSLEPRVDALFDLPIGTDIDLFRTPPPPD